MRPLILGLMLTLAADIPFLTGRVVDDANTISAAARERLAAALKAHEEATTNQIVVLTVPTIGNQSVEDYAVKVFESWKLGGKEKDNGILVVVVPQDRKMRIEVGYGLEGVLPDGAAGEIIRTWMTPAFKAGNYDKGIEDGVAAIISRLEGRAEAAAPAPAAASSAGDRVELADLSWPTRLLLGGFVFGILGLFTAIGILTPGVGWFLYVFLIPFWAIFPLFVLEVGPTLVLLAAHIIGFPIVKQRLKRSAWYQTTFQDLKRKGRATIGGFNVTTRRSSGDDDSSSSWSSSSSDSGSSFSGGGGSSGGGGASGSW
jgi:uncharacterized protein